MAKKPAGIAALWLLAACVQPDVARLLEGFMYEKPVLVVLSPAPDDTRLLAQRQVLKALSEKNLAVIEVIANQSVRLDGRQLVQMGTPAFYDYFEADETQFKAIFIKKDGVALAPREQSLSDTELTELLALKGDTY